MAISTNVSSIQSYQTLLNSSANNVANVNTDRYVPTDGTTQQTGTNSVSAELRTATDTGAQNSQTDLSEELTDQIVYENSVEANAASIRTQDELYGSLLDITV